ncbi:MAG: methionyl-tRNA formyltransferase [Gammaproteobacteria bacterium]
MKLIYAGTPDFSVPALNALLRSQHQVLAVYTQPDRPAGRGRKLMPGPVKQAAQAANVPVYQPLSFKQDEDREALASLGADAMVVAAYGLILPQAVLDLFPLGCINIHASLLPRWRGAAPIQRAIMAGDSETGICIMRMEAGLDTGPVLSTQAIKIDSESTGGSLHDQLAELGADMIVPAMDAIERDEARATPQDDSQATYAHKLSKAECAIDWNQDAARIDRQIRAFNPWPVAQCQWGDKSLRLWNSRLSDQRSELAPGQIIATDENGIHVQCGQGAVAITELQLPGKKRLSVADFLNAHDPAQSSFS